MIIKSMSRKNQSFRQLVDYFNKEQVLGNYKWNLYSQEIEELIKEFEDNAKLIKNSRGKVYLYHEVISLQKNNLSLEKQLQILYDLVNKYIQKRASMHLVYGMVHNDTANLHMHLMISANKVAVDKRTRLSKKSFSQIQKELEDYKNKHYRAFLDITKNYSTTQKKTKQTRVEQEIKHKRKRQTKKEFIYEEFLNSLQNSLSKKALDNSLKNKGFTLYKRGSSWGVSFENKNYRLKTLGLEKEYEKTMTKYQSKEKREQKRQEFKNSKSMHL